MLELDDVCLSVGMPINLLFPRPGGFDPGGLDGQVFDACLIHRPDRLVGSSQGFGYEQASCCGLNHAVAVLDWTLGEALRCLVFFYEE